MLDIRVRDRADRLSPEPGKYLVPQATAIDFERTGLPMPGQLAEVGVCDIVERRLSGDLRKAKRIALPARVR